MKIRILFIALGTFLAPLLDAMAPAASSAARAGRQIARPGLYGARLSSTGPSGQRLLAAPEEVSQVLLAQPAKQVQPLRIAPPKLNQDQRLLEKLKKSFENKEFDNAYGLQNFITRNRPELRKDAKIIELEFWRKFYRDIATNFRPRELENEIIVGESEAVVQKRTAEQQKRAAQEMEIVFKPVKPQEKPAEQQPVSEKPSSPSWTVADVFNKWFSGWFTKNEPKVAAGVSATAAGVGYFGAKAGIRSKNENLLKQRFWESLGFEDEAPAWFSRKEFEEIQKKMPKKSSQDIVGYMRKREEGAAAKRTRDEIAALVEQNRLKEEANAYENLQEKLQVEEEIKKLPASDQKLWRARFDIDSKRAENKDMTPLQIWQQVQEKQEESPAVRKAMGQ